MGSRFHYWLASGLSGVLFALVIGNLWLAGENRERQQEFNKRQAFILQVQQMDVPLYRDLTQTLIEFAKKGDKQIELLLAGEKITLTPETGENAAPVDPSREVIRPDRPRGRP